MRVLRRLNQLLAATTGRRLVRVSPPASTARRSIYRQHEVYDALAEFRRRSLETHERTAPIDLRLAELRVFSQNGEDGLIAELVHRLGIGERTFVEFGVEDGTQCNTRLHAELLGWSGVYFEPHRPDYERLAARWAGSASVTVVNEAVTPETVAAQFARAHVPVDLALLSIDVDGQDYWIWEALPDHYRPAIVVIECNTSFPPGEPLVEQRGLAWSPDFSDTHGASVTALRSLGARRGYTLVHVEATGVNAFFVRADLLAGRQVVGVTDRRSNHHFNGSSHPPTPVRPTVRVPLHDH